MVAVAAAGRARAGAREEAAQEVFRAYYAQLAGWTARLVGDPELAHEIAAEAFTRLLARWTTVNEPRPWLYMTATNLVRDHWRRQQRERRAFQRWRAGAGDDAQPAVDPSLRDLVERLPDRLRAPVLLHYYADLPVTEVARVLHRPEGTVKRALYDARALLHDALLPDSEDQS